MNLVFLSNYYNHHQAPLCEALSAQAGVTFRFVACGEMTEERRKMWGEWRCLPDFVLVPKTQADWDAVSQDILDADAVIVGSAPQALLRERLKAGKLIFRYQERPLKNGIEPLKFLPRMVKWYKWNPPGKPVYLLCASGFTAGDYAKFGLFRGRCYQWGYFPETRFYDIRALLAQKEAGSIFWAGRFLDWKHPDDALRVAARLRDDGYNFTLRIAGAGVLEPQLRAMVSELRLDGCVQLLGSLRPEQVRCEMERSRIFLLTSDRREGWGAVLNEAMNSGCAVVASDAAGATPFLVKDGVNGRVYHSGDTQELYEKVRRLLDDTAAQERLGSAAYRTISELWDAETAAERLLQLSQALLVGRDAHKLFADGPCSQAHPLREDWHRR